MEQETKTLVLEVFRQSDNLKIGLYENNNLAQTVRQYNQVRYISGHISALSEDALSILAKSRDRSSLGLAPVKELQKTGQLLWDELFPRPVKEKLKKSSVYNLILSIDEDLIHIPWEILFDGADFLCLKFNLGRLIRSSAEINPVQYRSLPPKLKMLILANPTDDLRSAYQEGIYIRNQLHRRERNVNIDFKSTRIDSIYVKKNLRDYDIIHYAGHCEYDEANPGNSGWILNDSKFGAGDVLALGHSVSLPSLVFSNACHSAQVSDSPDFHKRIYSLASAFLFSGVRHYIGAIQRIEDPVSSSFAKEFYHLLTCGSSVGESIQQSRMKLIKEYGMGCVFWASYVLYGDPSFVLFKTVPRPRRVRKKYIATNRKNFLIAGIIVLSVVLSAWGFYLLPSRNPGVYMLMAESRQAFNKGDNDKVLIYGNQLLKRDPLFLSAYPLLSETYLRLGQRLDALRIYFDYARMSEQRGENTRLAAAYTGIGWVYYLDGDYPKAYEFYSKALALSIQNKDKFNEAIALRKMAVWHMDKNDDDRALELLMKSSEINRSHQSEYAYRYNLACDYFDIGLVFVNKDDYVTAREFYNKSRILFEKLKLKGELSDYYFNLGELYAFDKQYNKALGCYMKGLKIDQDQGNKPNIAEGYNMIGELYVEMGNLLEAEKFFNLSAQMSEQLNLQPELAGAYYNLGLLYKQKGRRNKARDYLRGAQEIYARINTPDYEQVKKALLELE